MEPIRKPERAGGGSRYSGKECELLKEAGTCPPRPPKGRHPSPTKKKGRHEQVGRGHSAASAEWQLKELRKLVVARPWGCDRVIVPGQLCVPQAGPSVGGFAHNHFVGRCRRGGGCPCPPKRALKAESSGGGDIKKKESEGVTTCFQLL